MESAPHEFEALAVFLVLLPGFLCARVVQSLCVRPKQTEIDKIIESLLYSFVVYVSFVCIFGRSIPVAMNIQDTDGVKHYSFELQPKSLGELAILSIGLGVLIGVDNTNDLSGRFFRKIHATQRTTRSSVWSDVFHERRGVVLVELGDGRRVMGWAQHYSDDPRELSLFLEKAAWIDDAGEQVAIQGGGILITKELGVKSIEFLDSTVAESKAESDVGEQPPLGEPPEA